MTLDATAFRSELKSVILDAAEKTAPDDGLADHEPIFGPEARLALDSIDALQVSMALQKRYGVRLTDSKETRRVMANIATLADYLQTQKS